MSGDWRGPCKPYWSKKLKRWLCVQRLDGEFVSRRFYTEEAALKWFNDPAAHPDLPLKHEGQVNRKTHLLKVVGRTNFVVNDEDF